MEQIHRKKVIVCGVRFGQFYLEAVSRAADFELAGILSTGSKESVECAQLYGIKQYSRVEELPEDVDMACVVVRTGVLGGKGTELVEQLMQRKINVILEQPIQTEELKSCYKNAVKYGVAFTVGNLYANLKTVQKFLSLAERLMKHQQVLYVNVNMATQVSFPLAYILARLFPRCKKAVVTGVNITKSSFDTAEFMLGDVPVSVRAQNQMEAGSGDNYTHLFFDISIGFPAGTLILTDIHGAVIWRARMTVPDNIRVPHELEKKADENMREDSIRVLYASEDTSYNNILSNIWTEAILTDIVYLSQLSDGKNIKENNYKNMLILKAAELWHTFTNAFGYPKQCENVQNEYLDIEEIISEEFEILSMKERYETLDRKSIAKCIALMDEGSVYAILRAFQEKGVFCERNVEHSINEIYKMTESRQEFFFIIDRWLKILLEYKIITKEKQRYFLEKEILAGCRLDGIWQKALHLWTNRLGTKTVGEYFYQNAMSLNDMLEGKVSARYLLFVDGKEEIANDLYRNTMIAWYMNQVIATAVGNYLAEKEHVSILEIGAGTGATTEVVIECIKQKKQDDRVDNYHFTDISKYFLNMAEEKYAENSYFHTGILNLDNAEDFKQIKENSIDIIIAAGVLNNVNHIDDCLKQLKPKLSDRGIILISEAVTDSLQMQISQIFMMSPAEDDRGETMRTFMSEEQWHTSFERAGLALRWSDPGDDSKLAVLGQKVFCLVKGKENENYTNCI